MKKHTFICFALTLCFLTPDALMAQGSKECQRVVPRSDLTKKAGFFFLKNAPSDPLNGGFGCIYYESGKLESEIPFQYNKKEDMTRMEGISKAYYESGKLRGETPFKNGRPEGMSKEYYESGKLKMEDYYKNGIREGLIKEYRENGDLYITALYKTGSPVSGLCHHTNGTTTPLNVVEMMKWRSGLKIECD